MVLRALTSRSLADQVFDQLAGEIMTERYAAGSSLPSERALSELLGVNRQVIREALKRLEQLKLVKIAQGGATKVLDFRRTARLDLLAMMAEHARGGEEVARYWLSVLEMRAAIGCDMARLCALRAPQAVRDQLVSLSTEMRKAGSDEQLFALDVRFWETLVDGSDNIVYRLALNTMVEGTLVMGELGQAWDVQELRVCDFRMPIAKAIAAGDASRAENVTRKTLRGALETFASTLGRAPAPATSAAVTREKTTKKTATGRAAAGNAATGKRRGKR
jgi:DNA-binding FadR family transcriptional regulator